MNVTPEEKLKLAIGVIKAEDEYAFLEAAPILCGDNDKGACTLVELLQAAADIVLKENERLKAQFDHATTQAHAWMGRDSERFEGEVADRIAAQERMEAADLVIAMARRINNGMFEDVRMTGVLAAYDKAAAPKTKS